MQKLRDKIKTWIKRRLCRHQYITLMRWHWTHGPFGNDPLTVEAEYKCDDCGELLYSYLDREESYRWAEAMGNHKKW